VAKWTVVAEYVETKTLQFGKGNASGSYPPDELRSLVSNFFIVVRLA
jgi:hypothetical protein